ncbi:MAG: hypothetical protein AAGF49_10585 [Pseudomonadota bacterium]
MRKQMFEVTPSEEDLHGLYEIMRYENASQRAEIVRLENDIDKLRELVDALEEKLDAQQEVIDLYNAELVAVRDGRS